MTQPRTTCDSLAISRFLADELSEVEVHLLESHLDSCESCCLQMEHSAAEDHEWRDAREHLQAIEALELGPDSEETSEFQAGESAPISLDFLSPTDDPRMLGRLGGYEIVGVVGRGGFGIVLKGFDAALNRYVAIKVLSPQLSSSGAVRRRFAREAQAAAAVVHDNVIAIHSVDEANGLPYLVMPYIRGVSLQRRLREHGPLELSEVLRIGMQTAAGLAAAHAQGLVHRDIKPANVLLPTGVERVKLTDFGLARAVDDASLTRTGVIAGTPQYMSPEQAKGDAVDASSDLFSLGSLLYATCTGHPPFRADNSYGVLRRISDTQPRPIRETNPDIPEWMVSVIDMLLEKDKTNRFPSAAELAVLLEQCLAHVQQPQAFALPASLCSRGREKSSLRRRLATAAVGVLLIAGFALGAASISRTLPNAGDSSGDNSHEASHSSSTPSSSGGNLAPRADAPHVRWDDGVDRSLSEIEHDLQMLQRGSGPRLEAAQSTPIDAP